ncbi:MAG TPA: hypothetical protein VKE70_02765, partial [Candidatus Solibacter sp.]|nr:hypothetical protein [Candidatus Solibacter sp.]
HQSPPRGQSGQTPVCRKGALLRATIRSQEKNSLADDKLYQAEYLGSGTFKISKPKRKKTKVRQSALKNPRRGSRK